MSVIDRDSLLGMVASPLVWAAHFIVCYALVAVTCAFGFAAADGDRGVIRIVLIIVSLVALAITAGLAFLAARRWRQAGGSRRPENHEESRHQFMAVAALLLCVLSSIGIVYTAIPLLVLPLCQ